MESSRREFGATVAAAAAIGTLSKPGLGKVAMPRNPFSKWRGFYLGSVGGSGEGFITHAASLEDDLRLIVDWGFNAVRLRTDYTQWLTYTDKTPQGTPYPKDFMSVNEAALAKIDEAVNQGVKNKLHVLLCMFHGPGYDVRDAARGKNSYTGPYNLWTDKSAQDAFAYYWGMLAKRYSGIPADSLAFDLLNEPLRANFAHGVPPQRYRRIPTGLTNEVYARVVKMAVDQIRRVSPDRPIFAEGLGEKMVTADEVVPEIVPFEIGQSLHGYAPFQVTHFGSGADDGNMPLPTWPYRMPDGSLFGRDELFKFYKPFGDLVARGIPVLCGEFGVSIETPNDVALRYTTDLLDMFNQYGIGWLYLNLRGVAGTHGEWSAVLDSARRDAPLETWNGHSLNRQILNILQKH